jgi:hypothetical protein
MSEVRGLLERAQSRFPAPDRVMDRLLDRRDRKRRNRRIVSAVVALLIAAAAVGGLLSTFRGAGERRPASNQSFITPGTVGDLRAAWVGVTPHTVGSDPGIALPPVVSGNRVYVDSKGFFVYAFSTTCASGGKLCEPEWISGGSAHRAGGISPTNGIGGRVVWPPAATEEQLYQSAVDQAVLAYPASCGSGATTCKPVWTGEFKGVPSSPVISGGVVYVFAGGTLYAFPEACAPKGSACPSLWTGPTPQQGSHQPSHVVAAGGVVYVTVGRGVYAFSASCARSSCPPLWHAEQPNGVDSFTPVVGGGELFVAGSSREGSSLTAYPTSCSGTCQPSWTWLRGGGSDRSSAPVYADGTVYVTEGPSQGKSLILAFSSTCRTDGRTCAPEWIGSGLGEPIVSDGIVYVAGGSALDAALAYRVGCGTQGSTCEPARAYQGVAGQPVLSAGVLYAANGHDVVAFDLGCQQASCRPAWTGSVQGVVRSGPIVTDDAVYVGTSGGDVVAFKPTRSAAGGSGTATVAAVVLLAVAVIVGAVVVRRRRMEFT